MFLPKAEMFSDKNQRARLTVLLALALFFLSWQAQGESEEHYTSYMVFQDGLLFAHIGEGRLVAVEPRSRSLRWSFQDPNLKGFVAPVFLGDRLFALATTPSWESVIVALERATGKVVWRYPFVELAGNPSPVVCCNRVIVNNEYKTGRVVALQADSGAVSWDTKDEPYHFFHPPAVSGSQLYFVVIKKGASEALGIGVIDCCRGTIVRIISVEGIGVSYHPILLYQGKAILISSDVHRGTVITLFDLEQEKKIWETKIPEEVVGLFPIIANDRMVFGPGGVWVVGLTTGGVLLHHQTKQDVPPAAWFNGTVIFQSGPRTLRALRIDPERILWESRLRAKVVSNVVLCGKVVCVQVSGAKLALLDPTNGKVLGYIPLVEKARKRLDPSPRQ